RTDGGARAGRCGGRSNSRSETFAIGPTTRRARRRNIPVVLNLSSLEHQGRAPVHPGGHAGARPDPLCSWLWWPLVNEARPPAGDGGRASFMSPFDARAPPLGSRTQCEQTFRTPWTGIPPSASFPDAL